MSKTKKLPEGFRRALWSYNVNKIDIKKDKEVIITQVLNYATWKDIKRLFLIYPEEDIKEVLRHPRRGVWFEKVLNFWVKMFNMKLKKEIYEKAIFKLQPPCE